MPKGIKTMPVNDYLSPEKTEYISSLESMKRHRKTLQAFCLDNSSYNKLIRYIDSIIESESRKQEKGKEIIEKIQNQILKKILIYRYIDFYDWRKIADLLLYSDRQIFVLYKQALTEFDRIEQTFGQH